MSRFLLLLLVVPAIMASGGVSASAATAVAVFDFQMKSETPDWQWLEKALADRVITDLFQDKALSVVQRDEMERLSEKVKWVPEMATDPGRLNMIHQDLQMKFLISGVYEVKGDQLKLTAVIIDFETKREVGRPEVSGSTKDVLELVQRLSAKILAWLTQRPVEKIEAELPVWTRSVPAARALYEGMNLYDQGRYAEAWLSFRRAAREDSGYAEAGYWVGKMYYFLNRYDHARPILDQFLYLHADHPRAGDALVELVDTYEKTDASTNELLRLYEDLGQRFPDVIVPVHYAATASCWLARNRSRLLAYLGRYAEAVAQVGKWTPYKATRVLGATENNRELAEQYMFACHQATGKMWSPDEILENLGLAQDFPLLLNFGSGKSSYTVSPGGCQRRPGDQLFHGESGVLTLIAEPGKVFKTVIVKPQAAAGAVGKLTGLIALGGEQPLTAVKESSLDLAGRDGLRLDNLPRGGWLRLQITYEVAQPLDGLTITAEFEDLGSSGSLKVACATTADFRVLVDGRLGRLGPGLVGPLAPGEHRLEFSPISGDSFSSWETKVSVVAGQTREVMGQMPWRAGSPLAGWSPVKLVGRDYAVPEVFWSESSDPPSLLLDEHSIRLVWSYFGDLWVAESTDGRTFTAPHRLPLPVSTGWLEEFPKCVRDESGRFVLRFRGNRDERHEMHDYLCWSRDFEQWSAPFLAKDDAAYAAVLSGDQLALFGRFDRLNATSNINKLAPCPSSREVTLERPGAPGNGFKNVVLLRRDGRYEFLQLKTRQCLDAGHASFGSVYSLWRSLSGDGKTWSNAEPLAEFVSGDTSFQGPNDDKFRLAAVQQDGRTVIMVFRDNPAGLMVLRETAAGAWEHSPWIDGLGGPMSDLAYHPRWGFVLAWLSPTPKGPKIGPFVTCGPDLDLLLRSKPSPAVAARESSELLALARALELSGDTESAKWHYERVGKDWPGTPAAAESQQRLEALARRPVTPDVH